MKRLIKIQYRRRRQNKTDYNARRVLLESNKPRLIIRRTNRYIITQIAESRKAQDKTICSANSKELVKYGWPESFSIKNLSASYLTGYLCAIKALKKNIKEAILDLGLMRSTKGGKIYAALKGALDGGLNIPCDKSVFPDEKRLKVDNKIKEKIK